MGGQKRPCSTWVVGEKSHRLFAEVGRSDNQHGGHDATHIEHGIDRIRKDVAGDGFCDGVGVIGALLLPPLGMGTGGTPFPQKRAPMTDY